MWKRNSRRWSAPDIPPSCSCGSDDLEQLPSGFAVSSSTIRKASLDAVRQKGARGAEREAAGRSQLHAEAHPRRTLKQLADTDSAIGTVAFRRAPGQRCRPASRRARGRPRVEERAACRPDPATSSSVGRSIAPSIRAGQESAGRCRPRTPDTSRSCSAPGGSTSPWPLRSPTPDAFLDEFHRRPDRILPHFGHNLHGGSEDSPPHRGGGTVRRAILLLAAVLSVETEFVSAQDKTADQGVYTSAQAARGATVFDAHCVSCHREGGTAPVLAGERFTKSFADATLLAVFTTIQTTMPRNAPGLADRGGIRRRRSRTC